MSISGWIIAVCAKIQDGFRWVKVAATAILNLLFFSFWSNVLFPVAALYIAAKCYSSTSIGGRVIAVCAKIQDGGCRHLGFYFCLIFWLTCMWDLQCNTHAKFRASICNSKRVMSDRWNSKWRPPPFWIYYFCQFWSNGLFPLAAIYTTAKFHSSTLTCGWIIAPCAKIQDFGMATATILDFILVQYFGMPVCRTSNMPNFMQICAIINKLWAINEIQNGSLRHREFIIFVHFGQMVYFQWKPSTLLQNFIHLRQSVAELLLFVQKSKMAVATILDFIFV